MTTIASQIREEPDAQRFLRVPWLSGRLILLTLGFVVLAQALIYLPSIASFRRSWVLDRVMGAQMIALALSGPDEERRAELDGRLLAGLAGTGAVGVRGTGTKWLLTGGGSEPPVADREIDLRRSTFPGLYRGVFRSLLNPQPGLSRIIAPGVEGVPSVDWVEIVVDELPLRRAVIAYSREFLSVSIIVSLVVAVFLYLGLHVIVVRPVRRLSLNIEAFAAQPEDAGRVIVPSGRHDEIGRAEDALARMERTLAGELRRKRHLADLGLAVSKINHELRNMLTTAQLLGDRLSEVDDPLVRRVAPRLIGTLDRAIAFCGATLAYGRTREPAPERKRVALAPIVADQVELTGLSDGVPIDVAVSIPEGLEIDADPDQLSRVLLNLMRNAVEAVARDRTPDARIEIAARRRGGTVEITVTDNGPGISERTRAQLFTAFQASERAGGTGLGLPVAEELVRLHGGTIALDPGRNARGASFVVTIPDRPVGGR